MDTKIRHIRPAEWPLLEDFLYQAIFVPEGYEGEVPRSIIATDPKCRAAYADFGSLLDDRAVVAEVDGEVVGACWVRTTDEYGHIDSQTPSFSVSLYPQYRGRGLGTRMMRAMLAELREAGYARASLSVQKENPALRLYERLGFRIVGDGADSSEWLMVCRLGHELGLTFKLATSDDVPLLVERRITQLLEEGVQETVDLRPALVDHYLRHLADDTFVSWLALDGERVVATSGMSVVERPPYFGCPTGKAGIVSGMFTEPAYRKRGIARDLLCRVVDEAHARGCRVVQVTASDAGVPLYESVGFQENENFRQLRLADS